MFGHAPHLPPSVVARLPHDRYLTWTALQDGWAIIGIKGLYLLTDDLRQIPWSAVDRGVVDQETEHLTVRLIDHDKVTIPLDRSQPAKDFAQTFRERVQASIVLAAEVSVPHAGVITVAVRRDPDDSMFTQVSAPESLDLDDPATSQVVEAALARARDAVGLD